MLRMKRVYDPPSERDGQRVLVDALWPRGLSKERAHITLWLKEVAPSAALRQWFGHDPARFAQFRSRYEKELRGKKEELAQLASMSRKGPVTIVFGARDIEHNNAVVLLDVLAERARRARSARQPPSPA